LEQRQKIQVFEIIPPLLSRCRVFVFNELDEKEMKKIIKQGLPFKKEKCFLKRRKKIFFKKLNQVYKVELLKDLEKYGTTNQNEILKIKTKRRKERY